MVAGRVGGNLSGTQCREHWKRISPERKPAGNWTNEEDEIIAREVPKYMCKKAISWTKIAKHLPGRNNDNAKNRYHCLQRGTKLVRKNTRRAA